MVFLSPLVGALTTTAIYGLILFLSMVDCCQECERNRDEDFVTSTLLAPSYESLEGLGTNCELWGSRVRKRIPWWVELHEHPKLGTMSYFLGTIEGNVFSACLHAFFFC